MKIVVGLTMVAIVAFLVAQIRPIIGPLILAFILAYLLQPIAARLNLSLRFPWRIAVFITLLLTVIIILSLLALTGFAVIQQLQSLISQIQEFIRQLPEIVSRLSQTSFTIGRFKIDLAQYNLTTLVEQSLGSLQPILGRLGGLISTVAARAAVTLGYAFFIFIISYFLLAEGRQIQSNPIFNDMPGLNDDIRRLGRELTKIWDAFLRGQFYMFILAIIVYYIIMLTMGMGFAFGIAVMAGVARFIPYIGPAVVWTIAALVAYFDPQPWLGLQPWAYTLVVLVVAFLVDMVFDQVISPRVFGDALGLHPAAILVSAIVAASLLGFIGLLLAAPVLATFTLVTRYVIRKMFDLDPWPVTERRQRHPLIPGDRLLRRMRAGWHKVIHH